LFLPSDLNQWEKLNFIFFLSQKFWLEDYTPYGRIITQVKVMIAIILRNTKEEDKEEYLKWLASKYNLSEEFVNKIKNGNMIRSEAKEMVKGIKLKRWETERKKRLWSDEDVNLWYTELKKLFWEQFNMTFFRKWINMLRLGMMTITQAEQEEKIRYCKANWFNEGRKWNWLIEFTKWEEIIIINLESKELDEEERLLRDKIWINEYKERLDCARRKGTEWEIAQIEFEAANSIIKALYEYMYQKTNDEIWYEPSKIREFKEIYCVWYSLLGHAFLAELWIEHYWLNTSEHSALNVVIRKNNYYFDATMRNSLWHFDYWESWRSSGRQWEYSEIDPKWWWRFRTPRFAIRWDPEKILLSQIFGSKWDALFNLWRYKEAEELFNREIEINPTDVWGYYNKWDVLKKRWKHKLSKLYIYSSDLLEWNEVKKNGSYKKEKQKIKQCIDSKDYEWIREYLIELEKKGDYRKLFVDSIRHFVHRYI